jgi:hypothetical protein
VFLLDQSGSMDDKFGGSLPGVNMPKKMDAAADAINRLIQELVVACTQGETIKDRIHIAALGYGKTVGPLVGEPDHELVPASTLLEQMKREEKRKQAISDGAGGIIEREVRFPIWFDATAGGTTPMCQAFSQAARIVERWIPEHQHCFPPVVLNITDGESTDGDPNTIARQISEMRSDDGQVLIFNCHLSDLAVSPVLFPSDPSELPQNEFARALFESSSFIPASRYETAKDVCPSITRGAAGLVFNADVSAMVRFMTWGSLTSLGAR